YVRTLPSRPSIMVDTRVRSAWNAITWRSNISFTYSVYSNGMPDGFSTDGGGESFSIAAMRVSSSRMPFRYSSIFRRSDGPRSVKSDRVFSRVWSRMLLRYPARRARTSGDRLGPTEPNSR